MSRGRCKTLFSTLLFFGILASLKISTPMLALPDFCDPFPTATGCSCRDDIENALWGLGCCPGWKEGAPVFPMSGGFYTPCIPDLANPPPCHHVGGTCDTISHQTCCAIESLICEGATPTVEGTCVADAAATCGTVDATCGFEELPCCQPPDDSLIPLLCDIPAGGEKGKCVADTDDCIGENDSGCDSGDCCQPPDTEVPMQCIADFCIRLCQADGGGCVLPGDCCQPATHGYDHVQICDRPAGAPSGVCSIDPGSGCGFGMEQCATQPCCSSPPSPIALKCYDAVGLCGPKCVTQPRELCGGPLGVPCCTPELQECIIPPGDEWGSCIFKYEFGALGADCGDPMDLPCRTGLLCLEGKCKSNEEAWKNFLGIIVRVAQILYAVAAVIDFTLVIKAAYAFLVSQGVPQAVKSAQETLSSAVIGLVFLVTSATIVTIVFRVLLGM
jgi:hypothetical protein